MKKLILIAFAALMLNFISCEKEDYKPCPPCQEPRPADLIQTGTWFISVTGNDSDFYRVRYWSGDGNSQGIYQGGVVYLGGLNFPMYKGKGASITYKDTDSTVASITHVGGDIFPMNFYDTIPAFLIP